MKLFAKTFLALAVFLMCASACAKAEVAEIPKLSDAQKLELFEAGRAVQRARDEINGLNCALAANGNTRNKLPAAKRLKLQKKLAAAKRKLEQAKARHNAALRALSAR